MVYIENDRGWNSIPTWSVIFYFCPLSMISVSCFFLYGKELQISWPPETELTLNINIRINPWLDDIPNMENRNQIKCFSGFVIYSFGCRNVFSWWFLIIFSQDMKSISKKDENRKLIHCIAPDFLLNLWQLLNLSKNTFLIYIWRLNTHGLKNIQNQLHHKFKTWRHITCWFLRSWPNYICPHFAYACKMRYPLNLVLDN